MADVHRGSALSRSLGLPSCLVLLWGGVSLIRLDWGGTLYALVVSLLAAYGGYRAAGGRHNPELAKARWED
jgi:hypothetical protein